MTYQTFFEELEKNGVVLSKALEEKLKKYASLLKEWNEKMNLTSIVEEEEVIEKHFLDSLTPAYAFDFKGKKIADMGSGAGFPGMILALCFPEADVTLIDATKKKFLFLEEVKKELGIENVHFHVGRVEDMKEERETFDVVISRGFAAMRVLLEVGAPLLKLNGHIIAMKGPRGEEELHEALGTEQKLDLHLRARNGAVLPNGESRTNYVFEKTRRTAPKYPRDWATIQKKPL